jgi:hypothetical protein
MGTLVKRRWKLAAILAALGVIGYFHFSIAFYTYMLFFAEPIPPACYFDNPRTIATISNREFIFTRIDCTTLATVISHAVFVSHQGANVMVFEYYESDDGKGTAPEPSVLSIGPERVRISIEKVDRVLLQQQVPGLSIDYEIGYVKAPRQRHLGKRAALTH